MELALNFPEYSNTGERTIVKDENLICWLSINRSFLSVLDRTSDHLWDTLLSFDVVIDRWDDRVEFRTIF